MEMHTWPLGSLWEKVSWPLVNKKLLALMYSNGHCKVCIGSNDLKLGRQVTNKKKKQIWPLQTIKKHSAVSEWKHTLWKGPGNSAENEEAADADTELDEQNNTTTTIEM